MSGNSLRRPRVAVVEDSEVDLRAIARHLGAADVEWKAMLRPSAANSPEEVCERITVFDPAVLLLDLAWSPGDEAAYRRFREAPQSELERRLRETQELSAIRLLRSLANKAPELPVIVLTQFAYDPILDRLRHAFPQIFWFLEKPRFDAAAMLIERTLRLRDLELLRDAEETGLYGQSTSIRKLRRAIRRLAPRSDPVIVRGELGSGRSTIARALHALSGRRGELVTVDCIALEGEEAARALLGFGPTDMTGACSRARSGTLLVKAIHRFPAPYLPRLLAAWSSGQVYPLGSQGRNSTEDVRWVATAELGQPLPQGLVSDPGNTILDVQPLRERPEDLELLAFHFARRLGGSIPVGVNLFAELERVAEAGNEAHLLAEVRRRLGVGQWPGERDTAVEPTKALDTTLLEIERDLVGRALAKAGGSVRTAARLLGLTRDQLNYRLRYRYPELWRPND
jgi:DNA-binding NtrC family response regulator